MEGQKAMLAWEQKTLQSEVSLGLEAAKKLQARLSEASSPSSLSSYPAAETNEILIEQILSSYDKVLVMLNWSSSPPVQLTPATVAVVPVVNSGGIPESPASINGSPRSEDGGGSSESHRQDHMFNSRKRKMLPKWTEKVRISPERGLEGPQDDQVQRSDSDPTVFELTYRGTHTCQQGTPPPSHPPPASPEKRNTRPKLTTTTQKPNDILESLKTSLTVRTEGLDDADNVFSFPNTPPFCDFGTINDEFSSPIFDVVDWLNPTVEIDPAFPTFLQESIYY
ncbi:hypothetical protein IGI04_001351 [Brassica rapa subsp. trilocularis]|uniref:WRKY domain-containing protein n=1 Tax=Brassica rapa subsp. trilocularis TaxID=1813537 RepID=A0ABQ7NSK2_BRACM|nr:hypothetical protein IGI04_001351 [Brassica rapa subsp. trilocularis]